MSREYSVDQESSREHYPKFTCPVHKREKFIRVCTHPTCEKQSLLCGGCLLDDPEHGIDHKQHMKLIEDFIDNADEFYASQRNKTYKSTEISPELLEFVHDFDIASDNLAKKYLEQSKDLDIHFEECIKEIIDSMINLREEIKSRIKRNFEIISENYKFIMDKIKNFYNLVSDDELFDLYPSKDIIFSNLYNSETYTDCEIQVKKMKQDLYKGLHGSPKKQKEDQKRRLETKNQLLYLMNIIQKQMADYNCFDFEDENINRRGYTKMLDYCRVQGDKLVNAIKANITMHEVEKCLNLPKEALNQIYEVKDYDITDEAIMHSPILLHFFKQNTKTIYVLDVVKTFAQGTNITPDKVVFEKIPIKDNDSKDKEPKDIDFKIPYDHASICLPNGSIYLTGGTDYQKYFKDCFEFSLISKRMSRVQSMKRGRINHGICYVPEAIFVIGGYDGNKYLNECEKFDLISQKWIEIAPMNIPTACSAVCSFQDEYIYKIGGLDAKGSYTNIIERYDIAENQWSVINVNILRTSPLDELILGESSECVQLNNRQIIVFGGKYKNSSLSSTLLLDVDGINVNVKIHAKMKLPYEEFFRCPKSVVVTKGCLYTVSYYMRKVFMFNSHKWSQLN